VLPARVVASYIASAARRILNTGLKWPDVDYYASHAMQR
jgi:hypothetical protein